jgi:hypothetical protein
MPDQWLRPTSFPILLEYKDCEHEEDEDCECSTFLQVLQSEEQKLPWED